MCSDISRVDGTSGTILSALNSSITVETKFNVGRYVQFTERELKRITAALAAPRRLEIIKEIGASKAPYPCTAILVSQQISAATVSHHLKELERAGLIEVVRNGKFMNVLLRRDVLRAYSEYLKQL
jgi:ArsR family transcriptional regulator